MLALVAFLSVALLGVLPGIAVAVGMSILNVFRRVWWPHQAILGRSVDVRGYHDTAYHQTTEHLPGLAIYRFDAPLLFANARTFRNQVRRLAAIEPRPAWIIVAAEPITDVDTTAADMLEDLDDDLVQGGTRIVFAELKDAVQHKIESYGLAALSGDRFYPTIRTAVKAYAAEHESPGSPGPARTTSTDRRSSPQAGQESSPRPTRATAVAAARTDHCTGGEGALLEPSTVLVVGPEFVAGRRRRTLHRGLGLDHAPLAGQRVGPGPRGGVQDVAGEVVDPDQQDQRQPEDLEGRVALGRPDQQAGDLLEDLEADRTQQGSGPHRPLREAGCGEQPEHRVEQDGVRQQAEHDREQVDEPAELGVEPGPVEQVAREAGDQAGERDGEQQDRADDRRA